MDSDYLASGLLSNRQLTRLASRGGRNRSSTRLPVLGRQLRKGGLHQPPFSFLPPSLPYPVSLPDVRPLRRLVLATLLAPERITHPEAKLQPTVKPGLRQRLSNRQRSTGNLAQKKMS